MKLLVCAFILLCGCGPNPHYIESTNRKNAGSFTLQTVEYDGHKFILADGYHAGNLLHHPNCDCGEKR